MSDKGITHYVGDDCQGGHHQDSRIAELERQLAEAQRKLDAVRAWRRILAEQLRDGGGAIIDWNTLDRVLKEAK